jgi:hypothetical protein
MNDRGGHLGAVRGLGRAICATGDLASPRVNHPALPGRSPVPALAQVLRGSRHSVVMAGLVTTSPVYRTCGDLSHSVPSSGGPELGAIHVLPDGCKDVDARDKRGHDEAKRPGSPPAPTARAAGRRRVPQGEGLDALVPVIANLACSRTGEDALGVPFGAIPGPGRIV